MTEGKIYTISEASLKILRELKAPVQIKLYLSSPDAMPTLLKTLEQDVRDKLEELRIASDNKFRYKVVHMDLDFDVHDKETQVVSHVHAKTLDKPISTLQMDAKNLEIISVDCNVSPISYEHQKKENKLIIAFKKPIPKNAEFIITTQSTCRPTKNILEGLYYDETPDGCPPTQITQCQQWGFQRLVPCIDDMTAKCTYTTTITADKRGRGRNIAGR
jgi:aminopeptidase N